MPTFPIIDTHLHLWDPKKLRYPWLDDNAVLNKPFLLSDYAQATSGITVEKMVFLQCECIPEQCEAEASWVTEQAKIDPRIKGIVPLAPLENRNVVNILERYATNPLIKGIRRIIQFEPDPDFCLRPDFINGVQLLRRFHYTFDICINHTQLPNVIKLVSKCPQVTFILDHIAKPDIKHAILDPWRADIQRLAEFPNVHCKLSGLVTEADFSKWTVSGLKPYVDHVLACFGVDRLMFGGDWPVVVQASSYQRWVDSLDQLLGHLTQDQLRKIYYSNAVAFYRL